MKQLIIILGMAIFGCILYEMMVGNNPDSLKSITAETIEKAMLLYG